MLREWLKVLRCKLNFSQQEIANKLDIAQQYYSLIENGERQKDLDLSLVVKLAEILGVSINYIIEEEEKLKVR